MAEKQSTIRRPLIAIPARFSPGATALRYEAEVTARALVVAVFAAGGEPVVVHPYAPDHEVDVDTARERIWFADGVLLPGGGDVAARWFGQQPHPTQYGVDEEQDAFDLAVTHVALSDRLPLLAYSVDGVIEAVTLQDHAGWYLGVQWHPEDSAATDPVQAEVFRHFVDAAAEQMQRPDRRVSASAHV